MRRGRFVSRSLIFRFREVIEIIEGLLLSVFWICRSLTPLARAVDGALGGFELLLALEPNIALDHVLGQRDLEELRRVEGAILSAFLARWLNTRLFAAGRIHALHVIDIALGDTAGEEVGEASGAKDMATEEDAVTILAFLRFKTNAAVECPTLEFLPLGSEIEVEKGELEFGRQQEALIITCKAKRIFSLLLQMINVGIDNLVPAKLFPQSYAVCFQLFQLLPREPRLVDEKENPWRIIDRILFVKVDVKLERREVF